MSIETDFDKSTAETLILELKMFSEELGCYYDEAAKKVIYPSAEKALDAYIEFQSRQMEIHKWIESQKAGTDLKEQAILEWISKYGEIFAIFWRRTHKYVKS